MKTLVLLLLCLAAALAQAQNPIDHLVKSKPNQEFAVVKTDAQWKKILPSNTYLVLRKSATETPYKGKYWDLHDKGIFVCAGCGQEVFSSDAKFDSHRTCDLLGQSNIVCAAKFRRGRPSRKRLR